MDSSDVPLWRQRQTPRGSGNASTPDGGPGPDHGSGHNNRGNGRGRGYRGNGRGGGSRGGNGRGGRGGYQKDFYQKQPQNLNPQQHYIDESELYHQRDIRNYFSEEPGAESPHTSTFHDSKNRPGELAYQLLFSNANPRWPNDRIVFAKSKLALLPEYAEKKAEKGEWPTHQATMKQDSSATSTEAGILPPQSVGNKQQSSGVDEFIAESQGLTISEKPDVDGASNGNIEHKTGEEGQHQQQHIDEETTESDVPASPVPATTSSSAATAIFVKDTDIRSEETQVPATSSSVSSNRAKYTDIRLEEAQTPSEPTASFASKSRTKYQDVRLEETQSPSQPTPSSVSSNRTKYQDVRLEEAQAAPTPSSQTATNNRTKHSEIRTIPAHEYYDEASSSLPDFPTIAPIDYVPSNPKPIAVFEQQKIPGRHTSNNHSKFAFKGWFKISRVNILAPHSAELVRMLKQKWERRDRFGNVIPSKPRETASWNSSLAMEWAVVKFDLLEGEGTPPPPQIEKLPEPERPVRKTSETRGVNELLEDMRLNDGKVEVQKEEVLPHNGEGLEEDAMVKAEEATNTTAGLSGAPAG